MSSEITQKDVTELLNYDIETGLFTWKKQRRGIQVGKPLGTDNGFGYLRITVLGQSCYAHRLAWLYVNGEWPTEQIDHINGIRGDNRICNLRSVTNEENAQNKTKAKGVSWHKKANKWQAHACIRKSNKYLGLFNSYEQARQAYLNAKESVNVSL